MQYRDWPSTGNAMSAHAIHPSTVVCSRNMQVVRDGGVGWQGRDVTSTVTGVCITHSGEQSLHSVGGLLQLQAYNTGQMTDMTDTSYQITLTAATDQ